MIIALDYDGTYTADPAMWNTFIASAKAAGHTVVCVTMRHPHEAIMMPCEVVYTSRQAKMKYLLALGRQAHIWIDDMPHLLFQGAP